MRINPEKLNSQKIKKKPEKVFEVIGGKFFAGNFPYNPGANNSCEVLGFLLDKGVNAFVDLTEEDEFVHYKKFLPNTKPAKIYYVRLEIENYSVPDKETMDTIINRINGFLENGNVVYLHSGGGIGRTGLVIACYFIKQGYSFDEALAKLSKMFKQSSASAYTTSPDNKAQIDFIKKYS